MDLKVLAYRPIRKCAIVKYDFVNVAFEVAGKPSTDTTRTAVGLLERQFHEAATGFSAVAENIISRMLKHQRNVLPLILVNIVSHHYLAANCIISVLEPKSTI
jgi:hypothetical protein